MNLIFGIGQRGKLKTTLVQVYSSSTCATYMVNYSNLICYSKQLSTKHNFCSYPLMLSQHASQTNRSYPDAGEAVTMAQEVVKTMLSKGYILGKDALIKAKAFDESHQLSATAVSKVAELSQRIGLTDKFCAGVEAAKSVDQRYHVSEMTRSAVSATGRTAVAAATTVVNSGYFSKGALWVSDALSRAAKVAADLGSHGVNK